MKKVVIAGGGTAGWVVASALSIRLGKLLDITLVESDAIGSVGVGEATIPTMRTFHRLLDIDEQAFMRATQATFKLGIEFENWGDIGESYMHSFGEIGQSAWMAEFHTFWMEARAQGFGGDLEDYCLELKAAKAGKFGTTKEKGLHYAFHLDATLYARFLREKSQAAGVKRIEGKISEVLTNAASGDIDALLLEDGKRIEGELFIDCTGFRAMLIGEALKGDYQDWSHWLASDSALAVQTTAHAPPTPYTRAIAHSAGWQWRIPLQHRMGNGLVYSSRYLSDDAANQLLKSNVTGKMITEPRIIRYRTGRRKKAWHKNCVAMGLSSGFIEPLESTSIHLVMTAIIRLIKLFPFDSGSAPGHASLQYRYNEETNREIETIRDFIILHYKQTKRNDSEFWKACRTMDIPETLAHRIEIFKRNAYVWPDDVALFRVDSWVQVMLGQGIEPLAYHSAGKISGTAVLRQSLAQLKSRVDQTVDRLPTHQEFIDRYCPASRDS